MDTSLPDCEDEAVKLENQHVLEVYEEIASHFSETRHTQWPKVAEFLKDLPEGTLVADVGCGNGKYLSASPKICMIGCDKSSKLCEICAERGFSVFASDCLAVALRSNSFDACISIAVIHHMSTVERRVKAIEELFRILRPTGRGLIYVWAFEQERHSKKSNYLKDIKSKEQTEVSESSVLNNIGLQDQPEAVGASAFADNNCDSELVKSQKEKIGVSDKEVPCPKVEAIEKEVAQCTLQSSIAKPQLPNPTFSGDGKASDKLVVHVNRTPFESQDLLVPWHRKAKKDKSNSGEASELQDKPLNCDKVFHRYYHVFKEGELEHLCHQVDGLKIEESFYDNGNWCVIIEKGT